MNLEEANKLLRAIDQRHVLHGFDKLTVTQQQNLLRQIKKLDVPFYRHQKAFLSQTKRPFFLFSPFKQTQKSGNKEHILLGKQRLMKKKVGAIIVAGGQGTRLNFDGPKGLFPVSVIKRKTLFQLLSEKTIAASEQVGQDLPIAIMTSPINHTQTIAYFEKNHFFQLKRGQISFFCQEMLPMLDDKGNLFLEGPGHIAEGPDGNGSALDQFVTSGIAEKWKEQGIEDVMFLFIDNPLADPFDAELIGHHKVHNNTVTIKCVERHDSKEKVGLIVEENGNPCVIEYTEFPKEEWDAKDPNGYWRHNLANVGLYIFQLSFIEKLAFEQACKKIPLHLAHKKTRFINSKDEVEEPTKANAWKFERFIFDLLPYADKTSALTYPREICYAPLKNMAGNNSIETVRNALQALDYQTFHRISGRVPPSRPFELSQEFHYPTQSLLHKWKGKELPAAAYIEP
ncbi:MAG: UTP--glucose-1-phosphate uridylyltransferase [Parachlamydiales bacterium]|nr:UTP--glucose-1-phosphate uridylyltransferase [Parachlamydiales bacterium]